MNFQFLKYEVKDGVATVTLNRPDVYNALNDGITYELQDALKAVAKDDQVRVIVLTGEGKAFCSGQDLKAAADQEKRSFMDSLQKRYNPKRLPTKTSLGVCAFSIKREDITSPAATMRIIVGIKSKPSATLFKGNKIPTMPQIAAL